MAIDVVEEVARLCRGMQSPQISTRFFTLLGRCQSSCFSSPFLLLSSDDPSDQDGFIFSVTAPCPERGERKRGERESDRTSCLELSSSSSSSVLRCVLQ